MLSLGAVKDGVILPSEEDRKRIITQMKVRTTLKGDKSWIQQKADKEEEQQHRSPLRSPVRSRGTTGGSPISPRNVSPIRRTTSVESPSQAELQSPLAKSPPGKSPSATQPPGYLIRGVFTKTIDKTAPSNTASNGSPKSAKTVSLPRTSPGYKMSTEEYKKLAPYNVKREPTDPHDAVRTVSPDEQKKRTEAASSVLRRTAGKERSYVFSAAKKSSGSPTQEVPSFVAQRVDLEEDIGPRSRSQTVPASGWFSSRGKSGEKRSTSESPWSEPRMANAASTTSIDTGSRTQAPKPSSDFISTFNHISSLKSRRSGDQKNGEPYSRNDHAPKVTTSPSKSSENGGQLSLVPGTEKRGVIFSEDSYNAKPKSATESPTQHAPRVTISPEGSPKSRPSSHFRISDIDAGVETPRRPKVGEYASDAGADFSSYNAKPKSVTESPTQHAPRVTISPEGSPKSRPSSHFRISDVDTGVETPRRPKVGEYASDAGADFSRSALDQKEGNSFRDINYESPSSRVSEFSEHQPVTTRPPPFVGDSPNAIPGERYTLPSHLAENADAGPSRSFSGVDRRSVQDESPSDTEYKKVEAHLAKSGSWSSESSLGTTQSEFLRASRRDEPELDTTRSSSLSTESGVATPESQQGEYGYDSDTARSGSSHGMPSYLSSHSYNPSNLERSHGISSHLSNQAFDSGRSYYPFRDNSAAASPRSHRVPFYKDNCDPEVASGKSLLFVKESVNSTELSSSPRYNSRSMADLERSTYSSATSLNSIPPKRSFEAICTYCGREIRNCAKITIENLKICCHEYCFREEAVCVWPKLQLPFMPCPQCGICHKPMGDLLDKIFIHRDIVHCDKCYEKLF
ncbi:hypothetical protein lerEdw1_010407 [Lerista edwardsae]|nr:hypothetical protein lerEdw1_010407 [Lerista edwardsae]